MVSLTYVVKAHQSFANYDDLVAFHKFPLEMITSHVMELENVLVVVRYNISTLVYSTTGVKVGTHNEEL